MGASSCVQAPYLFNFLLFFSRRVLIKKSTREGAVWSCPILGRHRDMDKEACTIMVACKIFLASLLIFSAGSQVLDTVKNKDAGKIFPELDGTALRRKKGIRSVGSENKNAPGDSSRPRNNEQKKVCPPGTYWYVYGCARCRTCKENEKVVEECGGHRNRKCTCREGYFKFSQFSPEDFICKKCLNCSSLHQLMLQACHEHKDAQCGPCIFGFCKSGSACKPCPTGRLQSVTRASMPPMGIRYSKSTTQTPRVLTVEQCNVTCKIALAACGCFFLLGGALALCYKKKAMISARDQPLPAPDLYTAKPHFAPSPPFPRPPRWWTKSPRITARCSRGGSCTPSSTPCRCAAGRSLSGAWGCRTAKSSWWSSSTPSSASSSTRC
ncbi:tumor necrosis factor receptor superfamily member 25 isoform 2-T3 [Liasis olivaceus]